MSNGAADGARDPLGSEALASFLTPDRVGHSMGNFAGSALHAIRMHLGMDVAFISEFTAGQRIFRYVDAASQNSPVRAGDGGPLEQSYCQRVVDGRLPQLIVEAAALPAAAELPVTAELPVGAHLSVPIVLSNGRVYGTFCCFSFAADHSLNERDLAMMRVFADLTAAELERDLETGRARLEIIARVSDAIAGRAMSMVFQPIVDILGGGPVGFEALARFSGTPERRPDVFFSEAAAVGMALELELAAVRRALDQLPQLPRYAYLAVNASPQTVASGGLDAVVADGVANRIVVEITEHAATDAYEQVSAALKGLRRRGVRIAVDDAGAGYANFRHILHLEPDIIKLDMTLTRDIDRDPARRALASALITFAGDTGSTIVAEGIETAAELDTLARLGVSIAQGYYLGRPDPPAATTDPQALATAYRNRLGKESSRPTRDVKFVL